jgi:hypothetical protein
MSSRSLCETCSIMREVVTPRGSRFLLCTLSAIDKRYPKYPPQPIIRCQGYQSRVQTRGGSEADQDEQGLDGDGIPAGQGRF